MAINVLVLGHGGMLGNTVVKYLSSNNGLSVRVLDTKLRWPSDDFKKAVEDAHVDVIVNCIGAIHQKTTKFSINYEMPMWLDSLGMRVVFPGTDRESDFTEYGISKRIAREFIVGAGKNTKMLSTSIIGPEIQSSYSLLSWFLSQPDGSTTYGLTNHFWNGNTALTWAIMCSSLIHGWSTFSTETILSSECISKYELLCAIRNVFGKDITILPTGGDIVDKCLDGMVMQSIEEQLIQLKWFMDENN